jgi:hypothetical protein
LLRRLRRPGAGGLLTWDERPDACGASCRSVSSRRPRDEPTGFVRAPVGTRPMFRARRRNRRTSPALHPSALRRSQRRDSCTPCKQRPTRSRLPLMRRLDPDLPCASLYEAHAMTSLRRTTVPMTLRHQRSLRNRAMLLEPAGSGRSATSERVDPRDEFGTRPLADSPRGHGIPVMCAPAFSSILAVRGESLALISRRAGRSSQTACRSK